MVLFIMPCKQHSQFTGQRAGDAKTGKGAAYWEFRQTS